MHFFLVAPPLCTWVVERTLQKQATYSPHQHHLLFWPEFDQKFLAIEIGLWRLNIEMIIIISFHHHAMSSYLSSSFRKGPSKGDTNLHYFSERKAQAVIFFENCTSCQFSSNKAKIKAGFCRAIHRTHLGNWIRDKITGIFERHQDQESVIEKCEISWTIYHPVKIVSAHNCIHFVNGKQLGRILRRLLLRQPMSPPCIPWFKVYNKKYLQRVLRNTYG